MATMQGPHAAKEFVNAYLAADLPSRLVRYRNGWGVSEEDLPEPELYVTYEPQALDRWPTIITVAISTPSISRWNISVGGDPEYRVSYAMRTYVWVRGDGADYATISRDRLTTVVRSALLDHASLLAQDTQGCEVLVDEGTLREEYSDLTLIKGDRYLAGAYLAYTLNLNESVTRNPVGTVAEFDVEAQNFPLDATLDFP